MRLPRDIVGAGSTYAVAATGCDILLSDEEV